MTPRSTKMACAAILFAVGLLLQSLASEKAGDQVELVVIGWFFVVLAAVVFAHTTLSIKDER